MADILAFIDSKEIREYNQTTKFTPMEQAVLIRHSRKTTDQEKIAAWKVLLAAYSEEEFQEGFIGKWTYAKQWGEDGRGENIRFRSIVEKEVKRYEKELSRQAVYEEETLPLWDVEGCEEEEATLEDLCIYTPLPFRMGDILRMQIDDSCSYGVLCEDVQLESYRRTLQRIGDAMDMSIMMDELFEDKILHTRWNYLLAVTCPAEELPAEQRILEEISKVYKGKLRFGTFLENYAVLRQPKEEKGTFYALYLDDYSCPSATSGIKTYYGTLKEIEALMTYLESDEEQKEMLADTLRAFREFCNGREHATHYVCYGDRLLMKEVTCIAETELELRDYAWEHINVWHYSYYMKASRIRVRQCILWDGERYIRCIRPTFWDLSSDGNAVSEFFGGFWGFPGMLDIEQEEYRCRLYMEEVFYQDGYWKIARYEDEESAVRDIGNQETVSFSSVCDEIFGDG